MERLMLTDEYPFNSGPGRERTPVEVSLALQMAEANLGVCDPGAGLGWRIGWSFDDGFEQVATKVPVSLSEACVLIAGANAAVEQIMRREVAR
jgi:hypothetical protein